MCRHTSYNAGFLQFSWTVLNLASLVLKCLAISRLQMEIAPAVPLCKVLSWVITPFHSCLAQRKLLATAPVLLTRPASKREGEGGQLFRKAASLTEVAVPRTVRKRSKQSRASCFWDLSLGMLLFGHRGMSQPSRLPLSFNYILRTESPSSSRTVRLPRRPRSPPPLLPFLPAPPFSRLISMDTNSCDAQRRKRIHR